MQYEYYFINKIKKYYTTQVIDNIHIILKSNKSI